MSVIAWIVLSSIASFVASKMLTRQGHAIALAAVLAIASAGWASPSSAAQAPDAWITTKVKMALLVAEDVSATAVRVDTMDGKVTLHGTVSSADEKARAEKRPAAWRACTRCAICCRSSRSPARNRRP